MTFLDPSILWGLLGIGIPILIHLFNFRKPQRVLFSNIRFVKEVNEAVVRRIRLKQWLLLAVRILAIVFLVLAFANPVIPSEGQQAADMKGARSVVLAIDNSLSMSAADGEGVWLQQAKLLGREILKAYGPGDEFQVQGTGQLRLNGRFQQKGEALATLDEVDYLNNDFSFGQLVRNQELLFTEARNPAHVLYFLSDFQTSTILKDSVPAELNTSAALNFIPIGSRTPPNIYVSDIKFRNTIIEPGKPVTLQLTLNNDSEESLQNLSLRVRVEGQEVSIGSVDELRAGQRTITEVTFTPRNDGWNAGEIVLDDPEVEFDNHRYFTFYIPTDRKILLVDGAADMTYLNLFYDSLLTNFDVTSIPAGQFATKQLSNYSTIVLGGLETISSGMRDKLSEWVKAGGGLIFFPSEEMEVPAFNLLYENLGVGTFGPEAVSNEQPKPFSPPDLSYLLFQEIFEEPGSGNAEFDSPLISRIHPFEPQTRGQIQQTLLRDQSGRPVLNEAEVGNGRVFTFTIGPNLSWSDWPLKSSFPPVLYRATLILNNIANNRFSQTIGNYDLYQVAGAGEGRVKLVSADSTVRLPEQYERAGNLTLKFDFMDLKPGNYRIVQNDSLLGKIAFNLADAESKLNVWSPSELSDALADRNLPDVRTFAARPDVLRAEVQTAELGIRLWKWFLIGAALMLLAEVVLGRLLKS